MERAMTGRRVGETAAVVAAVALQLVVGFFTSAMGLMAPAWAIALFTAVWLAAVVVLYRLARTKPLATPAVPLVNGALLWALLGIGDVWLGWTA